MAARETPLDPQSRARIRRAGKTAQREFLARYFADSVEPILIPLAADAAHPFPSSASSASTWRYW